MKLHSVPLVRDGGPICQPRGCQLPKLGQTNTTDKMCHMAIIDMTTCRHRQEKIIGSCVHPTTRHFTSVPLGLKWGKKRCPCKLTYGRLQLCKKSNH